MWGWTFFFLTVLFTWLAGRPMFAIFHTAPNWVRQASAEAHPFMPYLHLTNLAIVTWGTPVGGRWVMFATTGIALAGWFVDRGDDDRWKRRRRKLADRVRSLGHRLAVAGAR